MKSTGKNLFSFLAIALIAGLTLTSCKKDDPMPEPMKKDSIVTLAQATPSLSILVEALTMYPDLVSALSADGNFTVFAPTNDAFAALLGVVGQSDL
ncbi:MAG: fasciclin domain-containing protein, partial [Bacteroidales bacterium]|nr:fasciclin domain-containing protein [Bacteroidales bacterium]